MPISEKADMSASQQGSVQGPVKVKKEIKKRSWSTQEEEVLLSSLKGLVATGWKSDNGFRANYMTHLEEAMRKAFPNTDIKGKPHIDSKLHAWKKTYSALRDILSQSGVGFNLNGDFKIDCDDVLWEEICRGQPKDTIKNWRNKSWSYYDAWQLVFGRDRATGGGAAQFPDMLRDLPKDENGPSHERRTTAPSPINVDDEIVGDSAEPEESVGQSAYTSNNSMKMSKKRPFEETISSLVELVGEIQKTNKAKFEVVNSSYAEQKETLQGRKYMPTMLQNLPGLTQRQKFRAAEKLLKAPECLELFMGLSDEARPEYIEYILSLDD